jgi:hypothetical protein
MMMNVMIISTKGRIALKNRGNRERERALVMVTKAATRPQTNKQTNKQVE